MSFAQGLPPLEEDFIFPAGDLLSDEPPLETLLHLRQMNLLAGHPNAVTAGSLSRSVWRIT